MVGYEPFNDRFVSCVSGAGFVLATDWGVAKIGMNSQHVYDAIFQTDTMQLNLDEAAEAEHPSQTSSVDHDSAQQKRGDPESQTQHDNLKSSNRRKSTFSFIDGRMVFICRI